MPKYENQKDVITAVHSGTLTAGQGAQILQSQFNLDYVADGNRLVPATDNSFQLSLIQNAVLNSRVKTPEQTHNEVAADLASEAVNGMNYQTARLACNAVVVPPDPQTKEEQQARYLAVKERWEAEGYSAGFEEQRTGSLYGGEFSTAVFYVLDPSGTVVVRGGVPTLEAAWQIMANEKHERRLQDQAVEEKAAHFARLSAEAREESPDYRLASLENQVSNLQEMLSQVLNAVKNNG